VAEVGIGQRDGAANISGLFQNRIKDDSRKLRRAAQSSAVLQLDMEGCASEGT